MQSRASKRLGLIHLPQKDDDDSAQAQAQWAASAKRCFLEREEESKQNQAKPCKAALRNAWA